MLNINTSNTKDAELKHLIGLNREISLRIDRAKINPKRKLGKIQFETFSKFIKSNINGILVGNQRVIISLNSKLMSFGFNKKKLESDLNLVFNYDWFRNHKKNKYDGFKLSKNLNIETCPYCNRNYTTSTRIDTKSKSIYPAFDHYLPQDEYPLLVLSFYNLIPTCTICNTTKSNKDPLIENILYPYQTKDYINKFRFQVIPKSYKGFTGKSNDFYLKLKFDSSLNSDEKSKIEKTISFFDIKEILEGNHKDLVNDIIWKSINYNNAFQDYLVKTFRFNKDEIYKLIFETYYEDHKLKKMPFSKLKKDIFDDLNI